MGAANKLQALFLSLSKRAKAAARLPEAERPKGGWVGSQLQAGALVAMRVRPKLNGRLELRIARKAKMGGEAWEKEVDVFLEHFAITPTDGRTPCEGPEWWLHESAEGEPGEDGRRVLEVRLLELRPGEITPGRAACWDCREEGRHTEIEWGPFRPKGQRCAPCATNNGKALLSATKEK